MRRRTFGCSNGRCERPNFPNFRSVTDSTKALEIFNRFQPDLVLLDLYMPEPDGFAVLKQLRETAPAGDFLPVLVLTGQNTAETRNQAIGGRGQRFPRQTH